MKLRFTLLTALMFVMNLALAQNQPFGHLTIFSENGDKFYLILNGEKINDVAQTNLRVEELTQPYYNAKIIFEDKTRTEISKNYLQITDADGTFMDVTYKIKRDKNNAQKMKMNYFSMIPVDRGFIPPANVVVMHYGQPMPQGTMTQTTTTTSVGGVSAGVNMGGVGVNVTINDPYMNSTVTQTTTTQTSSTNYQGEPVHESTGCGNGRAMNQSNFSSALQTVKGQSFDDTKLKTAKQIASSNCMTATQIAEICKVFGFEESKLDFAKFAFNSCTEPNNYFKVNNVFSFSASVDELTEYISAR